MFSCVALQARSSASTGAAQAALSRKRSLAQQELHKVRDKCPALSRTLRELSGSTAHARAAAAACREFVANCQARFAVCCSYLLLCCVRSCATPLRRSTAPAAASGDWLAASPCSLCNNFATCTTSALYPSRTQRAPALTLTTPTRAVAPITYRHYERDTAPGRDDDSDIELVPHHETKRVRLGAVHATRHRRSTQGRGRGRDCPASDFNSDSDPGSYDVATGRALGRAQRAGSARGTAASVRCGRGRGRL